MYQPTVNKSKREGSKMGRKKREYATVKFHYDLPISTKAKLDKIAEKRGQTKTTTLVNLIKEANRVATEESEEDSWLDAGKMNRKQNEFVNEYIRTHFGEAPADPVYARSQALKAYYDSLGYEFGTEEEEGFILPTI